MTNTTTPVVVSAGVQSSPRVNAVTPNQRLTPLQRQPSSSHALDVNVSESCPPGPLSLKVAGIRPLEQPVAPSAEAYATLQIENQQLRQQVTELKQKVSDLTMDTLTMKKDALSFEDHLLTLRHTMNGELGTTARLAAIKVTVDSE